jgi:hypothetical protein
MAGWFLDILIGYLIRFMVRMVLPKGTHITVRVKPGQPETSIVSDKDQDQAAMKLRARFD